MPVSIPRMDHQHLAGKIPRPFTPSASRSPGSRGYWAPERPWQPSPSRRVSLLPPAPTTRLSLSTGQSNAGEPAAAAVEWSVGTDVTGGRGGARAGPVLRASAGCRCSGCDPSQAAARFPAPRLAPLTGEWPRGRLTAAWTTPTAPPPRFRLQRLASEFGVRSWKPWNSHLPVHLHSVLPPFQIKTTQTHRHPYPVPQAFLMHISDAFQGLRSYF